MAAPRLERVTSENVRAACELRLKPEQEHLVAPVVYTLADAYVAQDIAWPRLIYDGDQLTGSVMGAFDPFRPTGRISQGEAVAERALAAGDPLIDAAS
jgi:diamine N-acetyltransferase